ncbi:SDR family oxidoreductase [Pseudonocardia ailaonensis]|uniref:SDR family oxidoreductase n=1 Tax=Pseudonocardia ailaonensis TaxID=367279 RepID=A0ABN2NPA7_9PSEU
MSRFESKVALVTGAASGIGAATSRKLVEEGARVVLFDVNAETLATAAKKFGDQAAAVVGDVRSEADIEKAVTAAVSTFGSLDLAFNIAGTTRIGAIVDIDPEDWKFTVDVILNGTFLTTRHAARQMCAQGTGGAIVNVSSLNSWVPLHGGSAYAAGKAAVDALTRNAALELGAHGIRVNAVLPGLTDTPMIARILAAEELAKDFVDRVVLGRPARPEEIADACVYLASDQASYITGSSLAVDGGWNISNYPNLSTYAPG